MKVYNKITDVTAKYPNIAVALGMFDGIHIGHQSIIKEAVKLAQKNGGNSAVFTFSNHPLSILSPGNTPLIICDNELKISLMEKSGVDILFNVPFTKEFSRVPPEKFLAVLKENLAPKFVVTGANFTFGRQGKGTPRMLLRLAEEFSFTPEICSTVLVGGKAVSSTRIRECLQKGDLTSVGEFLGRPFDFCGHVAHGDKRGRLLGFPTANLKIENNRAMLPNGVYAVWATLDGKTMLNAVANVGDNPTFGNSERRLEVNIDNFDDDIYGKLLTVKFLAKIRDEQKFSSADELISQIRRDKTKAAEIWQRSKL